MLRRFIALFAVLLSLATQAAALSLDGTPVHVSNATGTLTSPTFTTSGGSGVIIVAIGTNATSITSVTASGLTFTQRKILNGTSGSSRVATYTAPYTSNFSGTVTVVVGSAIFGVVDVFAVTGSPTSSFFDTGAGIPGSSTSTNSSITTTNANDFIFFNVTNSSTSGTPGAGWTIIGGSNFQVTAYQIASSTGTFTTSLATGTSRGSIIDAIVAGSTPSGSCGGLALLGAGC